MELHRFLNEGRPRWQELETLLGEVEARGLKSLGVAKMRRFGSLYRQAASDLLYAKSRVLAADVLDYLNDLVARSYAQIYARRRFRLRGLLNFLGTGFPQTFRRVQRYVWAAAAVYLVFGVVGYIAVRAEPSAKYYLLPPGHLHSDPAERVRRAESSQLSSGDSARFTAFLFTHNLKVMFLCFALGITFGVGTVLVLILNGLMIGAVAGIYHEADVTLFFWAWILPHGVPELFVTFLSAGAGLMIGRSLVAPGDRPRGEALRGAAREAIALVLGGAPILVLAGFIEGTISQTHEPALPYAFKLTFAAILAVALALYLGLAGRRQPHPRGLRPRPTGAG